MQKNKFFSLIWIAIAVFGRLIPHPANMTPITSMGLFGGAKISRKWAFVVSFAALIISDLLLKGINGTDTAFGSWTLFTYTGFAAIIWFGSKLGSEAQAGRTVGFLIGSSLFYWIWTNLGAWAIGDLYPRNAEGFIACYVAAIPFLRNALLGDLVWGLALFMSFNSVRRLSEAKIA